VIATLLTVNAIYSAHPVQGITPTGFTWSSDGTRLIYIIPSPDLKIPPVIRIHDVRTGSDRALFRARAQVRGSRSRPISEIVWSPDGRRIAYINGGDLWISDANGERPFQLARDADDPQWAPRGDRVAYVHANDLYVSSISTRRSTRLTFNGSQTRINGDPDWLYSEELDVAHAYRWSPKGDAIAYLSFDELPIKPFPIQDYLPVQNTVEYQRYPLAGAKNPYVSLNVVDVATRRSCMLYNGAAHDEYVVSFAWTPDGKAVIQEILDRPQRHLRVALIARDGSYARTVWQEHNAHFVDVQPEPKVLKDGSFLWLSARNGVQSLYHVWTSGRYRRLTSRFPVASVLRADERGVYVAALAPARRDMALVYVPFDGGRSRIVTGETGWHDVTMPEHGSAYVDVFSSFTQPPAVTIRALSSAKTETLFRTPSLGRFDLGTTRALEIASKWGPLDAELTVPRDFNPAHRYPVIVYAYGGPLPVGDAVPSANRWQGLYTFLLVQHGFLVFTVDGPASNVDRTANEYMFWHRMGLIAMAGQLAGVDWLKRQPYVDPSRIGLFGWSYGGYLTAFTLTHAPGVFRSGIAGAPPADWHFYDTAYTERYMGLPQHHPRAYKVTSVIPAAPHLQAKLLIMQGSSDDNVHLMNSVSLLQAFIDAGKQVSYFLFPGARHGVAGVAAQRELYEKMLLWWERTLK
jgi:dipeptidyl-peptidase-4